MAITIAVISYYKLTDLVNRAKYVLPPDTNIKLINCNLLTHPDDISTVILKYYYRKKKNQEFNLNKEVHYVKYIRETVNENKYHLKLHKRNKGTNKETLLSQFIKPTYDLFFSSNVIGDNKKQVGAYIRHEVVEEIESKFTKRQLALICISAITNERNKQETETSDEMLSKMLKMRKAMDKGLPKFDDLSPEELEKILILMESIMNRKR